MESNRTVLETNSNAAESSKDDLDPQNLDQDENSENSSTDASEPQDNHSGANTPQLANLGRSSRISKPSGEWWIANSTSANNSLDNSDTALFAGDSLNVPQTYGEAMLPENYNLWRSAIESEEHPILENQTFIFVQRQTGMNVITCRYVFRMKSSGPEVRIVAKGFRQVHGVDFS